MADIHHRVGIKAPIEKIYAALTTVAGLSNWWTQETRGTPHDVGSLIQFRFEGEGPDMKVVELVPNQKVRWKCVDGIPQWLDTEFEFHLESEKNNVAVGFRHSNWKEADAFFAHCSTKWAVFLLSLKDYVEHGQGRPFPYDLQISHD